MPAPTADGSRTSDYDFVLPERLIAQTPSERRDESRLMVVDRVRGTIEHRTFHDLAGMIPAGDALVLNTTRVLRARLLGHRASGGRAEIFLLHSIGDEASLARAMAGAPIGRLSGPAAVDATGLVAGTLYEAMVHPGSKLRPGRRINVGEGFDVEIVATTARGTRIVRLQTALPPDEAIERHGHVPLPPYIARADAPVDDTRYQTVYAQQAGSVAAPTAGLHFTPELLATFDARGVRRVEVLLHVGVGTFKPVEVEALDDHVMHEERYELSARAAGMLNATRAAGGRVWAVGTTSCRTLESAVHADGSFAARADETRLFLRPPAKPRAVDNLVTNFHLPRSTLLMLVATFAGYELMMRAYREAIDDGYRFYSYGDAMVII